MIIGISGKKKHGKSTAADGIAFICDQRNQHHAKMNFADRLKEAVRRIYDLSHKQVHDEVEKEIVDPRWGLTPRFILQKFGTEVGRSIHPGTWVISTITGALKQAEWAGSLVTIADTRFKSEADAIRAAGGIVIRINREGVPLTEGWDHPSETDLDDYAFDAVIENNGTHGELYDAIAAVLDARQLLEPQEALDLDEALDAIRDERRRQDKKFGVQDHVDVGPVYLPIGTDERARSIEMADMYANLYKERCDANSASGHPNYLAILMEEVYEARAEAIRGDLDKLDTELVQVAAVAVKWRQALARRRDGLVKA